MFLILLTYKVPIEAWNALLRRTENFSIGRIKQTSFWYQVPQVLRKGGVIVSLVKTRDEVDEIIKADPFNLEGIADYNVFEFQALKFHPSLEPLVTK